MKAIIASGVICPYCRRVMDTRQEDPQAVFCVNNKCENYAEEYAPPTVELIPLNRKPEDP